MKLRKHKFIYKNIRNTICEKLISWKSIIEEEKLRSTDKYEATNKNNYAKDHHII